MKNKIISSTLVIIGFAIGATALSALADWTTPSCDPSVDPGACNTSAPLNLSSLGQVKDGPLTINALSTAIDDIGLKLSGKIKIVDDNQAAGRVLTSDANGVGTWQSPGYELSCLNGVSGAAYDRCCRVDVLTGEVICKQQASWDPSSGWFDSNTVFEVSTPGKYSISMNDAVAGWQAITICRMNISGTSECKVTQDIYGWTIAGPWAPLPSSPF